MLTHVVDVAEIDLAVECAVAVDVDAAVCGLLLMLMLLLLLIWLPMVFLDDAVITDAVVDDFAVDVVVDAVVIDVVGADAAVDDHVDAAALVSTVAVVVDERVLGDDVDFLIKDVDFAFVRTSVVFRTVVDVDIDVVAVAVDTVDANGSVAVGDVVVDLCWCCRT